MGDTFLHSRHGKVQSGRSLERDSTALITAGLPQSQDSGGVKDMTCMGALGTTIPVPQHAYKRRMEGGGGGAEGPAGKVLFQPSPPRSERTTLTLVLDVKEFFQFNEA